MAVTEPKAATSSTIHRDQFIGTDKKKICAVDGFDGRNFKFQISNSKDVVRSQALYAELIGVEKSVI
jgi:hypothetical protein